MTTKRINPIMQYFEYSHLPPHLQAVSAELCDLAKKLESQLPENPETSAGLRKLLEAKDCFVRASLTKAHELAKESSPMQLLIEDMKPISELLQGRNVTLTIVETSDDAVVNTANRMSITQKIADGFFLSDPDNAQFKKQPVIGSLPDVSFYVRSMIHNMLAQHAKLREVILDLEYCAEQPPTIGMVRKHAFLISCIGIRHCKRVGGEQEHI